MAKDALQLVTTISDAARSLEYVPQALGISICELVDTRGQVVSEHTIAWQDPQIVRRFNDVLPTVVEADCRTAAVAESRLGAGRDFSIFLYVTVGTGISSCLVIDGTPYKGARGATGTMATGELSTFCSRCGELRTSNLEQIASGAGMAGRYRTLLQQGGRVTSPLEEVTTELIVERAREGDPTAEQVLYQGATCLGSAIAQLINVLDPHAAIIGGGLGTAPGYYWETLANTIRTQIWSDTQRTLPIVQGSVGELAAAIGAAVLANERFGEQSS